jgi:hypothetical protein
MAPPASICRKRAIDAARIDPAHRRASLIDDRRAQAPT